MTRKTSGRINLKRNIIIGLVCVAALSLFVINYLGKNAPVSPSGENEGSLPAPTALIGPETTKWEVEVFDTEYRPKNLTIRKGETVTWTNKGSRKNWPASDHHPTHGKYPFPGGCIGSKFDACAGLVSGQSYTFQFDRTGVWNYHDHLAPGLAGTINVEP